MTTVAEVLAEHAMASSEDQVAAELRVLLGPAPAGPGLTLSAAEDAFLAEHGGVRAVTAKQLANLDARSAARSVAEVAGTLSRREAAELLGIDQTRLSHRVRDGAIYAYPGAGGRRRFPDWQFRAGGVLPRLSEVLTALPQATHPMTIRSFMTTPDDALLLNGEPVSPVDWLDAGGDPAPVCELAETLGEQQ